uniref:Uncharacterized protein n=1 Tax=Arundo donax TaxID=35708 RepID=A0A0A9DL25_ARUDO
MHMHTYSYGPHAHERASFSLRPGHPSTGATRSSARTSPHRAFCESCRCVPLPPPCLDCLQTFYRGSHDANAVTPSANTRTNTT